MPWAGGTYTLPAGTIVAAGNTIESTWANAFSQDVAAAFNTDTPIAAGGTGASTKQGALDNLFDGTTHIDADNLRIADQSDNTKLVDWDVSGVTTGTTRTITVPDADITIAGIIDEDNMASDSATRVPSQQSVKAYADAVSGLVLLGTLTTGSGTSVSLTGISSAYRRLYIECDQVSFTGVAYLTAALSSTNGSSYGAARQVSATAANASNNFSGYIEIGNLQSTASNGKSLTAAIVRDDNTVQSQIIQQIPTDTGAAADAIQFAVSANAFDSGSIRVYGVK